MSPDPTRPDLVMPQGDLSPEARKAAEAAYRNWHIGDDGEGRLHAALIAYERVRGGGVLVMPQDEFELVRRFREAVENPGPLVVLPSDHWRERAEAAEAKLAAIADLPPLYIGTVAEGNAVVSRPSVLAIIGGEEEEGRG